jgi:hypothetical protein
MGKTGIKKAPFIFTETGLVKTENEPKTTILSLLVLLFCY